MARQIVFTARAPKPPLTYSQAVKAAGLYSFQEPRRMTLKPVRSKASQFKNRLDSVWQISRRS